MGIRGRIRIAGMGTIWTRISCIRGYKTVRTVRIGILNQSIGIIIGGNFRRQ